MTGLGGRDSGDGATRAAPIADNELEHLFSTLRRYSRVVLAVSGGADSMALLLLAARWRDLNERRGVPAIEVATVDHGLRPDSPTEARWVRAAAKKAGFSHQTLTWNEEKPATGIEEAAREARYRLLLEHASPGAQAAAKSALVAVVTAHTEDDQAETLLMRLARGSGLDGLSSMAARRPIGEHGCVDLVRPLLGLPRRRLVATLRAADTAWVEDPSNACLDFERVRLRAAQSSLTALGLANDRLALSARRLARAREVVEQAADAIAATVDLNDGIAADIDRERFAGAPEELRVRLLMRVLVAFGGDARPPRLQQVEALAAGLSSAVESLGATLGGCIIKANARAVRIYREADPAKLPEIALSPGGETVWDQRFRISAASRNRLKAAGVEGNLTVRALGPRAYATLRKQILAGRGAPARALHGLPSVWAGARLLAVPQLGIFEQALASKGAKAGSLCSSVFVAWDRDKQGNGL